MQKETQRDPSTPSVGLSRDFSSSNRGRILPLTNVTNIDRDETPKAHSASTSKAPSTTPGVWIKSARGSNKTDRLAWREPDGTLVARAMTSAELADPERAKRRKWRELNRDKAQSENDAARIRDGHEPIKDVLDRFFDDGSKPGHTPGPATLIKPRTRREYRRACDRFVAWCLGTNIATAKQLTDDRADVVRPGPRPRRERGATHRRKAFRRVQTDDARSPFTLNKDIRALKTVLRWLSKTKAIRISLTAITEGSH